MSDSLALNDLPGWNDETSEAEVSVMDMFIVFKLGRETYAIPIDYVKEVMPLPKVVKLPQPPEFIVGAINVRGNVYAVLDTGAKISGNSVAERGGHLVVLDFEGVRMALLVEDIPQAKALETGKIETNSKIIGHNDQSYILGVLRSKDEFVIILNVERFLESI